MCRRCYNRERYRSQHPAAKPARWTLREAGFCPSYPREQRARENRPICPVAPSKAPVKFCFYEQDPAEWSECAWYWRRQYWLERRRSQRLQARNEMLVRKIGRLQAENAKLQAALDAARPQRN